MRLDGARVQAQAVELSRSRCPGCCQRLGQARSQQMETGWRERERRLRGAGSLQGQGSGVGSTGPGDTQRSELGSGGTQ